jgi:hypothetical protein
MGHPRHGLASTAFFRLFARTLRDIYRLASLLLAAPFVTNGSNCELSHFWGSVNFPPNG